MAKAPAYQRYPKDYLSDENVALMTLEAEGAYNRLMDYCWLHGSIPADPAKMAPLCKTSPDHMDDLWPMLEPCFRPHPEKRDRLVHPRLQKENEKQQAYREKMREAGKKGARVKREKQGQVKGGHKPGSSQAGGRLKPSTTSAVSSLHTASTETEGGDSVESPVEWMHADFLEILGGDPPHPKRTPLREQKYRSMYEEQLRARASPREAWRWVLLCVASSDHHMSQRAYQMPESFLKSAERRERWMLDAEEQQEAGTIGLSGGDKKVINLRQRMEQWNLAGSGR